jgi:hypothetical protein
VNHRLSILRGGPQPWPVPRSEAVAPSPRSRAATPQAWIERFQRFKTAQLSLVAALHEDAPRTQIPHRGGVGEKQLTNLPRHA